MHTYIRTYIHRYTHTYIHQWEKQLIKRAAFFLAKYVPESLITDSNKNLFDCFSSFPFIFLKNIQHVPNVGVLS